MVANFIAEDSTVQRRGAACCNFHLSTPGGSITGTLCRVTTEEGTSCFLSSPLMAAQVSAVVQMIVKFIVLLLVVPLPALVSVSPPSLAQVG